MMGGHEGLPWWRGLVSSVSRQALQTAVPILATVEAAEGRVDPVATLLGLAGAVLVVCVHAGLRWVMSAGPAGPVARTVSAMAGVAAGLVPQTAAGMLELGADGWQAVAVASVAGGMVSLASWWSDPPAPAGRHVS